LARYLVEPVHALDGEMVDPPGAQGGPRVAERMSGIVMAAPSPPKCAARTAMMIATYATTVMTAQRSIRLPTPHRKVMTNTTMKMPAKMTAKVAILSISPVQPEPDCRNRRLISHCHVRVRRHHSTRGWGSRTLLLRPGSPGVQPGLTCSRRGD